jgi:hypothetical protein
MPERWERIYRNLFHSLLAMVAALILWKIVPVIWESLISGGWRPRAAFALLISWYFMIRFAAQTGRFRAFANRWQSSGLFKGLCFSLLVWGLPLSTFAFLAPLHHRAETLIWIVIMCGLLSIATWLPTRRTHSDTPQ